MNPVILTAAVNGPIATLADHPGLPVTPEQIATAAADAYAAGAAIAHVHIRDEAGLPTADLKMAKVVMERVAERCPILFQLSTGVGLTVPYEDRARLVELKPRMATLNPCTMSFGVGEFRNPPLGVKKLAGRMRELGIKAELEIYDSGHVDACLDLLKDGLLVEPLQFSIVMGVKGGMSATVENLLHTVRRIPDGAVWQAIAIGRTNLDLTTIAMLMGGNVRTGLEDTLNFSKGVRARDSAQLVERVAGVCKSLGREVATVQQATQLLGLAS
jgi:3-keto-5-aminohexanoate cleavage enzyme